MTLTDNGPHVECLEWRPCERGTLLGFAKISIPSWRLEIDGVAVHIKDGRQWAQLPSKPMLDSSRELVREDDGRIKYSKVIWFTDREVADRFSAAVISAIGRRKAGAAA
jgi:hypothetical protein